MLKRERTTETCEDLFLARYEQLLKWALQLTDHDPQQAEDLVHDVFIKFALARPDLQMIDNLDGYLYTSLRNTYRSQVRRAGRGTMQQLSLLDYDSAELGVRFVEPRQVLQVQEELSLICRYACSRKEAAKAGSVLILRYFLGYFPGEIAGILRAERQAVAELLRVARAEARLIVQDPQRLRFACPDSMPEPVRIDPQLSTERLLLALRNQIFHSCRGECLPPRQWRQRYGKAEGAEVDRRTLAHLVSCPRCLDEVNHILQFPRLADRNPTDFTGPDPGSKGGTGDHSLKRGGNNQSDGGSRNREALKRFSRRVRWVYEHDPRELRIVVNSQLLGSQEVGAGIHKQTLSLSEAEPIAFIEVYSEQEVRLAYLIVEEPPKGDFEQKELIELSDGRKLEVCLSFKGVRPELRVTYDHRSSPAAAAVPAMPLEAGVPPTEDRPAPDDERKSLLDRLSASWTLARLRSAVILGAILIAAGVTLDRSGRPAAAELLNLAAAAEASREQWISSHPDQVFHRTLELEESRADDRVVARRRIEIWRTAGKQLQVRRLYDEDGRLIAGEWRAANGAPRLYRRRAEVTAPRPADQPLMIDELWRVDLSTKDFTGFVGDGGPATVEQQPEAYLIGYRNPSQGLISATIALDRRDLHPIEQRFRLRYAKEDRVVRFVEKLFEPQPLGAVGGQVFEVEPELTGVAVNRTEQEGENRMAAVPQSASPPAAAPVTATVELEIKALVLLHQVGADLGEEVSVVRGADGKLKIEAVVETARRQDEILQVLAPIAGQAAVSIRIETVAEALRRRPAGARPPSAVAIQEYSAAGTAIPAEPELRTSLARQLAGRLSAMPADEAERLIETEMRQFATRMLKQSQRALLQAYALQRLMSRFSPDEIRAFSIAGRAGWLFLLREHARKFSDETGSMRRQLQPLIGTAEAADGTSPAADEARGADLVVAVERLFKLWTANDQAVRSAFAVSTQEAASSIKLAQLWRSLFDAEKLSGAIQQKLSREN